MARVDVDNEASELDHGGEQPQHVGASRLTRRELIGRLSRGAVVTGVSAWVAPEILIARPTAAGALSSPGVVNLGGGSSGGGGGPVDPGGPGGGRPGGGAGSGGSSDPYGLGPSGPDPNFGGGGVITAPVIQSPGTNSAGSTSPLTSTPVVSAATSGATGSKTPATAQLAFTGVDLARDAEIGAAMIVGGWALTRWSSTSSATRAAAPAPEAGPGPVGDGPTRGD